MQKKSKKNPLDDRKRQRYMMADWAMSASLPPFKYPLEQYEVAVSRREEFEQDFQFLLGKGCDTLALEAALCMAKAMRAGVMPKAGRVRGVAEKLRALAREISELESSYFLIAQESEELNRGTGIPQDAFHDGIVLRKGNAVLLKTFPHFALPVLLKRRARMYDDWLRNAKNRMSPRADLLRQVKRMSPVIYVKWATAGHPFCDRVANLLRLAGIVKHDDINARNLGGTQLNRELVSFEGNYPLTTDKILGVLQPIHRHERSWPNMRDIVGLYLNKLDRALVLCADEKKGLDHSRPPALRSGEAVRSADDYVRSGATSLFAALEGKNGRVLEDLHDRYRSLEFRKFLHRIDLAVPRALDVHLIVDNVATYETPLIHRWLARHPRFHPHLKPLGASWLNLVERWFVALTEKQIRWGVHRSTRDLEEAIRRYIEISNQHVKPFVWSKSVGESLASGPAFVNAFLPQDITLHTG
jgi:DDE superfamily endonuclease